MFLIYDYQFLSYCTNLCLASILSQKIDAWGTLTSNYFEAITVIYFTFIIRYDLFVLTYFHTYQSLHLDLYYQYHFSGPRRNVNGEVVKVKENNVEKELQYDIETKINEAVFPGLQGGPHDHAIAAVATTLKQATSDEFKAYQEQVFLIPILCLLQSHNIS